jgi:hypothetical protein
VLKKKTRLTYIQVFLLEECEAINGECVTNACGFWHESCKCMSRPKVQILSRNFGALKYYKYKLSVIENF